MASSNNDDELSLYGFGSGFDDTEDQVEGPRRSQRATRGNRSDARGRARGIRSAQRRPSGTRGRLARGGRGRTARAPENGMNRASRTGSTNSAPAPSADFQTSIVEELSELKQQVSSLAATVETVVTPTVQSRNFSPESQRIVTSFKPIASTSKGRQDRDLSPISDEGNISDNDFHNFDVELSGPHQKLTEKAEAVFASLPGSVQKQLPIVSSKILYKLLSEKQFGNLTDLLPRNRTPSTAVGAKLLCVDAEGQLGMKIPPKQDSIFDFTTWARALNVLKMYRVAVNPSLAIPVSKYMDYITQLAFPSHGYLVDQWLNYDRQCRLAISRNPTDHPLWTNKNDEAYNEYLNQPNGFDAGQAQSSTAAGKSSHSDRACFLCHETGHMWKNCPERMLEQHRTQSLGNLSFRSIPAGNGAKKGRICNKWNNDECNNGPVCRYKRQQECKKCGSRFHRQSGCKNPTAASGSGQN